MAVEFVNAGWLAVESDGFIEEGVPEMKIRHIYIRSSSLSIKSSYSKPAFYAVSQEQIHIAMVTLRIYQYGSTTSSA